MGRQAVKTVHTDDIKIDQHAPLVGDLKDREPEIVQADASVLADRDYAAELLFMEEPVTIRIEPSQDKNAATAIYCAVNGKGCEIWNEGQKRWMEIPHIPVGRTLTIKRKYVAVLAAAKATSVSTKHDDVGAQIIDNQVTRVTSAVAVFSVMGDSAKGNAWLEEIRRRNF